MPLLSTTICVVLSIDGRATAPRRAQVVRPSPHRSVQFRSRPPATTRPGRLFKSPERCELACADADCAPPARLRCQAGRACGGGAPGCLTTSKADC